MTDTFFNEFARGFENKINSLLESIEECESNIQQNCDYLKFEIEITVDSVVEEIHKLRLNLFSIIDAYKNECTLKLESQKETRTNLTRNLESLKERLKNANSNEIQVLKDSIENKEKQVDLINRQLFRINFKDLDNFSLTENLIGELYYTDSNFNEIKYLIDLESLKNIQTYHETNCIINFDLEGEIEIYSRKIVSLQNRHLLIAVTTIDTIDYLQMDTQIKILNEDGVLLKERFILDFGLIDCHLISNELLVCILEDKVNYAYSIATYTLDINLVDTEILTFEVQSMCVYNSEIYVLSADSPLIIVFDKELKELYSFNHLLDVNGHNLEIDSYSIYVHNGFLYSQCITSPQVEKFDLKSLRKQSEIKLEIDRYAGDTIKFVDAFERIIVHNDSTRNLKIFGPDGKLLYKREIDSNGIFCISQTGRLVFYDKLYNLHIY